MSNSPHTRVGKLKMAAVPLLLAALAACASPFNAKVSRFNAQLPAPQGQTFTVVADDPALAGGLEFSQYARFVEGQMTRLGYTPANSPNADLVVKFDYGVDKGRERIRSTGFGYDPFWNPWYGYGRFGYWGRPFGYGGYRNSVWGFGWQDPFFDNQYES